ncbi:MAG: hypothetical protein ACP5FZ_05625 [Fidelibacterota bacterium]
MKIISLTVVVMLVFTAVMTIVLFAKRDGRHSGCHYDGGSCSACKTGNTGDDCRVL